MPRYYLETEVATVNENAVRIFVIANGKVISSQIREKGTSPDIALKRYKKDKKENYYITGTELKNILHKQKTHAMQYAKEAAIRSNIKHLYY